MSRAGCQTVSKARDISKEMALISSGIEDLHQLLGEQKQHIQGRVTWSESKLMIGNQAIGEEGGFNLRSNDEFHSDDRVYDWEKANWSVVAGITFCTFFMQSGNVC